MMYITGGSRKGFKLKVPKGIKPTSSFIRKVIYDTLDEAVFYEARVLDLFAGSGSLGLEALSRGASFAVFVDVSMKAVRCIRDNLSKLNYTKQARVIREYAERFLNKEIHTYDVVFADPPYDYEKYNELVSKVADVLEDGGIFVLERSSRKRIDLPDALKLWKEKAFKDTSILFLVKEL